MGYLVQGRVEISIYFNDEEFLFDNVNVLNYLHISESRKFQLPALTLSIMDRSQYFSRTDALKDGAKITIVLKASGGKSSKTMNFRVFSYESEGGFTYTISGYRDFPIYFNTTSFKPIYGSSTAVLQEVAGRCGMEFDGVSTNDVQNWYPRNLTYAKFVRSVVDHGWVTDTSFMDVAVSASGKMIYRDLNSLTKDPIKLIAYSYADDSYPVTSYELSTSSGFNNQRTGYWNTYLDQSIIVNPQVYSDLTFKSDSKEPLLSIQLREQLSRGQWTYTPIDVGNIHYAYQKASYQNIRFANLLSFGVDFTLPVDTEIEIFDRVSFTVQSEDASITTRYVGIYTVAEKITYVQGANYVEKITAFRHGTNT